MAGVNDSPIAKRRPTTGANPKDLPDDRVGGNKHSTTGGGRHENLNVQDAITKGADKNEGFERFEPGENSRETSDDASRSQGSTLTKAGLK